MNSFTFNGINSRQYGVYVSGSGTFNSPELDVTFYEVRGRCGDIAISNGRYKNVTVTYPAFIRYAFKENAEQARAWLLSPQKYCRLEDDYDREHFRLGLFSGPLDFDMRFLNRSGDTNISFNCKPQRYLKIGETAVAFSSAGKIVNPTLFSAKPLITVYGSGNGSLVIGDTTVSLTGISEYVTLDCDVQDAYKGLANKNSSMTGSFPELSPGENIVSFSGGITRVEIVPRWWTL